MQGSIFVFSRSLEDIGTVRQEVEIFAADAVAARLMLDQHLESTQIASGEEILEFRSGPDFRETEVTLDAPKIVASRFSHI